MATGLDRLAALDDDELDALIEIAQARASGALSRRDLLKAGGTLGALGLVGGSAVGSSAADASTSDSDSNAGRPSDRVDVFADGVDANSVSTGNLDIEGADLVASGDVLPISSASSIEPDQTASSTSFSAVYTVIQWVGEWDEITPTDAEIAVNFTARLNNVDSGTVSTRLYNATDGEVVTGTEITSSSTGLVSSGWSTYTPATQSSPIRIITQLKSGDGSTVRVDTATAVFGIKL